MIIDLNESLVLIQFISYSHIHEVLVSDLQQILKYPCYIGGDADVLF